MLVLSRKTGQSIIINDNIVITIAEVRNETVRVAIEAPREIKIYRKEIYEEISRENKMAATNIDGDFALLKNK